MRNRNPLRTRPVQKLNQRMSWEAVRIQTLTEGFLTKLRGPESKAQGFIQTKRDDGGGGATMKRRKKKTTLMIPPGQSGLFQELWKILLSLVWKLSREQHRELLTM